MRWLALVGVALSLCLAVTAQSAPLVTVLSGSDWTLKNSNGTVPIPATVPVTPLFSSLQAVFMASWYV